MPSHKFYPRPIALLAIFAFLFAFAHLTAVRATAQTETTLYNFSGTSSDPITTPTLDSAGNLYGTSLSGGVWQLQRQSGGTWVNNLLYNIAASGFSYSESSVLFDSKGNIYATSVEGGAAGDGAVIELVPQSDGSWTEVTLHTFGKGDGQTPSGQLVFDAAGNLYGTTQRGGLHGAGSVYELSPQSDGSWTERIIHNFGSGTDGSDPYGGLTIDASGNLYGTTTGGGVYQGTTCNPPGYGCGTVFELSPTAGGFAERVLHSFGNGADGDSPWATVIFDAAGNLYGTTGYGGAYTDGTVYELLPQGGGKWKEKLLHVFAGGKDGIEPFDGVIFDASGNLYGATFGGGKGGVAFELEPRTSGPWQEFILHEFGTPGDGASPDSGLVMDASGTLYGTTFGGGANGVGTAFSITH
jgi:uncharacterized repeat protein (TIGR03803 family)